MSADVRRIATAAIILLLVITALVVIDYPSCEEAQRHSNNLHAVPPYEPRGAPMIDAMEQQRRDELLRADADADRACR